MRPSITSIKHCIALVVIVGAWLFIPPKLQAAIISEDTVIDASNSFQGTTVTVNDGSNGPTTLQIVNGGTVAGFFANEQSHVVIDGGEVTYLGSIQDNAKLSMITGQLSCSNSLLCSSIDYDAELTAADSSEVHFHGNVLGGAIRLLGESTAHFYGHMLRMYSANGQALVSGIFRDGTEFSQPVFNSTAPNSRIILNEIPEPSSFVIVVTVLLMASSCQSLRSH